MSRNWMNLGNAAAATVGLGGLAVGGTAAYMGGQAAYNSWQNNRQNSPVRAQRELQRQFDGGRSSYLGGNEQGLADMQDAMGRAEEFNVSLDTRGMNLDNLNNQANQVSTNSNNNQSLGIQGNQQQQADNLLNQHMMSVQEMANQTSQAASQVPGVVDMGLRQEEEARGRRDAAFNTQLGMQGARFQADLDHAQALRARPLNRDVSHQENDAQLAFISAQNRGATSTALLNMYAQMANSRAGMYRA